MSFISLHQYILVDKKVVRELDPDVWVRFHTEMSNRRVKYTSVNPGKINEVNVSTVFLGTDHCYMASDEEMKKEGYQPLIFETMTTSSDGAWHDIQIRYRTWKESMDGHADIVKKIMRDRVKFKFHRAFYL